jgi:cation transport ATPase
VAQKFKYSLEGVQENIQTEQLMHLTYLCENSSEHPLAKAIVQHVTAQRKEPFDDSFALKEFKNFNGEGVSAKVHHAD